MARITPSELLFIFFSLSMLSLETVSAFHLKDQQSEPPKNLMKEYMTRGMLQCTAAYVETIAELQKLIKKAYMEHMKCQEEMDKADKNYPEEDTTVEEAVEERPSSSSSSSSSSSLSSSSVASHSATTESPLSRRKRTHR
ncbi:hypothetical protein PENTCL1PPCAC_1250, partial [Pristionchus entomophagus]